MTGIRTLADNKLLEIKYAILKKDCGFSSGPRLNHMDIGEIRVSIAAAETVLAGKHSLKKLEEKVPGSHQYESRNSREY